MYLNYHHGQKDSAIVWETVCGTWRLSKIMRSSTDLKHNLKTGEPKFLFKLRDKTYIFEISQ